MAEAEAVPGTNEADLDNQGGEGRLVVMPDGVLPDVVRHAAPGGDDLECR